MVKPSWGVKLGSATGFLISFTGLAWLVSLPHVSLLYKIGHACALLTTMVAVVYCWAVLVASIGKERNWRLNSYRYAGLFLLVPGMAFYFLGGMREFFLLFLIDMAGFAMWACPKAAFPHLSESEIGEEMRRENEPLSLFPK